LLEGPETAKGYSAVRKYKTADEVQDHLDLLCMLYDTAAQEMIAQIRTQHVIPYCDRENVSFRGGMGTWCFWTAKGDQIWNEDLPLTLYDILNTDLHTSRCNVGAMMEDYTPQNFKK
jgi:hypothetical protein